MRTINSTLEALANESEGRYLTGTELQPVQRYLKTVSLRLKTYELMRDRAEKLVNLALRKFMVLQPEVMRKHGSRCQYDMSEVMRYVALAVLRDDERFFKESLLFWQANILTAYRQNGACVVAYQCLKETLNEHLPAPAYQLIEPYISIMMQTLDLPPKLMASAQRAGVS